MDRPRIALLVAFAAPLVWLQLAPLPVVPTEVQLPGTQPGEVGTLSLPTQCDNCHGNYAADAEPAHTWRGSMMAHAGRDLLFWATLAVAEQDFTGAGDLCLRCHAPRGWLAGRSSPTNGSALLAEDAFGVECAICHKLVDPDGGELAGVQNAPFVANDGGTPAVGFYGSGMMVLSGGGTRLGPYANANSPHQSQQSLLHRSSAVCGTCHDVSNPVVGDLAQGNGSELPLAAGSFSGVPGSPVDGKAAFNNFPYRYGVTERTFSEHQASGFAGLAVRDYALLPAELQRGVLAAARQRALLAGNQGDFEDGVERTFSCQTCHMLPRVAKGASQNNAPVRSDLAQHDLTGGGTWAARLVQWAGANGRLPIGAALTPAENAAIDDGVERARAMLRMAAALDVRGDTVRVVNLTGHKLTTGYPEGRRAWLQVRYSDRLGNLLRIDGAYGPRTVTVAGVPQVVETLLDLAPANVHVYQAKYGISQAWAQKLLTLGVSGALPLEYDRDTGAVLLTLGQLAASPAGTKHATFHFVLNDTVVGDTRIPPYGLDHDQALLRNARPVPASLYGDPGPGGVYDHFDDVALAPPVGAVRAEVTLLYQTTSWEYVQFLLQANDGTDPMLGALGQDLFDGWLATGMSPPEALAEARWCRLPGTGDDLALVSGVAGEPLDSNCAKVVHPGQVARFVLSSPGSALDGELGLVALEVYDAGGAMPPELLPGLQLDRVDALVPLVLGAGSVVDVPIPANVHDLVLRAQGAALSTATLGGFLGTSGAHDIWLE